MKKIKRTINREDVILSCVGDHLIGIVVVDKNGKIERVNMAFETLTGWKEEEVMGKSLIEVIPREDENRNKIPFEERVLSKILAGKIVTTILPSTTHGIERLPTFYHVRKDKSRFPVNSVINPIVLEGKIVGAVEVFYDVTKEKELERIRMDFLSLASHQLRTPLSGTKWLIETMNKGIAGEMTDKQKEYLDDIYKTNEQMIRLVSDILSTLRLEGEETIVKKEKVSVSFLFEDILIMMAVVARERKIALQSPLNHRVLSIETDPEILKSILGTFLSNAINYSRPGQKVISDVKEESKALVFFVRDFGIGIPKNEQNRMFERFYRASNAKKMKPTGTGLGLNIAKTLAEKIGAQISFESEENKGSTFYLRIPRGSSKDAKTRNKKLKSKKLK